MDKSGQYLLATDGTNDRQKNNCFAFTKKYFRKVLNFLMKLYLAKLANYRNRLLKF